MSKRRIYRAIPLLLPLLIFWLTGVAGLDYGYHWDEPKLLESVRSSVFEGTYLPSFYNYPSVSHNLAVLTALPEIVRNIGRNHLNEVVFHGHIAAYQLDHHSVTLRTRLVFLTVSSLAIVWVYCLMLSWRDSVWIATFSACVMAFSWEVAYHARWIAPDVILMQFASLTLLCVVQALRYPHQHGWLWGAVIGAGLATGTKYPAGLLLLPVLMMIFSNTHSRSMLAKALLIFAITYLITTPGTLLQPFKFWHQVEFEMWHYSFGHSKHTVNAGLEHLLKNLEYLSTVLFSRIPVFSFLIFALSLLGIGVLWRESRKYALIIVSFPVVYLLYMSAQRALLIRNLLVIVPFLAVWAGLGVQAVYSGVRQGVLRVLLGGLLVMMLTVNAVWVIHAARTIADRRTEAYLDELRAWVEQFPEVTYYASERVRDDLGEAVPDNVTDALLDADEVLVYLKEIQETDPMPANIPRLMTTWFGSWEANIEYYTWHGDDKILLLPVGTVRKLGVLGGLE